MPNQNEDILITLERLSMQINRLVSDAESEKEFRKQRNIEVERRLRKLETWQSEMQGKIIAIVGVGGLIWTIIAAVIIKFLT